jgi:WD40 repeat protein
MTPIAVTLACAAVLADLGPVRTDADGVLLPPGAVARIGSTRFRHLGNTRTVYFTPDGTKLVSLSGGGVVVTDVNTGLRLSTTRVPRQVISSAMRADAWLAVVTKDRDPPYGFRYEQLDPATGTSRAKKDLPGDAGSFALSPDGARVALKYGGLVKVLDTTSLEVVGDFRFSISDYDPKRLVFSPDGKLLGGVFGTNWTEVREVATGNMPIGSAVGTDGDTAAAVAFSPAGGELARVVSGTKTDRVELIDLKTEAVQVVYSAAAENRELFEPVYAADGRSLFFARHRELFRYDFATKRITGTGELAGAIRPFALAPDGSRVVTVGYNEASVWDANTLRPLPQSTDRLRGNAETFEFVGGGKFLALGGPGHCQLFDATTGKLLHERQQSSTQLRYAPAGDAYAVHSDTALELRRVATDEVIAAKPHETARFPGGVLFTRDGATVFARNTDLFRGWHWRTGREVGPFPESNVAWQPDPDGKWAMKATYLRYENYAREMIDLATGDPHPAWRKVFTTEKGTLFNPAADEVLIAQEARCVLVDLGRFRRRWEVPVSWYYFDRSSFSKDGRTLATLSSRGLDLWEVSSGRRRARFVTNERATASAFADDGRTVATLGPTAPVHLWDVRGVLKQYPARLDRSATQRLWKELHGDDAEAAFVALQKLAAAAETTVPFVHEQVRPAAAPKKEQVAKWLAALDAPAFRDREAAMKSLKEAAATIEGDLRTAERATPSPEVHERIGKVLSVLDAETPEAVRRTRTVELIEWCGTPAAKELLREWSGGAPGASLTREAARATIRIK